jgi:hypothetical protein
MIGFMVKDYTGGCLVMNDLDSLRAIYPYNPQTRAFTILARVNSYIDFFNPIDPSPAPARDLSPELVGYLSQCSDEILNKYRVEIVLQVQNEAQDTRREQECLSSLRTFYQHEKFVTQNQIRRKRGLALKYIIVSLSCLAVYIFTENWSAALFLWNLLREAILIGGWVFMWEAVTLNFIEMDVYDEQIKKYRRLIEAKVGFVYNQIP